MSGCATGESMISIASRRTSRSGISRWHLPRRYLARNNSDGFIGPGSDHLRSSRRVREMDPNSRSPVRCDTPQRSLISQREKHAEWRPALRLRIEQPGEEHRFRCRLSPPDRLARTDQPGKSSASGAMVTQFFTRRSATPSQKTPSQKTPSQKR
jgi:hypothetical protein